MLALWRDPNKEATRQTDGSCDIDETITLFARMARFIIANVSDAKAVLQELPAIVPDLPSVPVQSIILATQEEPGMFNFYQNRPSFLTVHRYADRAGIGGQANI